MLNRIKSLSFLTFFNKGHERTINIKKNIASSFVYRGIAIAISLVQLPLTLTYLNNTQYGVWITLGSIINWFAFFDVGLGHGLRNKFAEALAKNDKTLARIYVSTTYAMIIAIVLVWTLLFLIINPFLNWVAILQAPPAFAADVEILVLYVMASFALGFILQLIKPILMADQKPAINDLINLCASILTIVITIILIQTTESSLLLLGISFSFVPVVITLVATIYLFVKKYPEFIPSIKFIELKYARDLTSLGVKFFIIQIAGVVIYSTDNMIITQTLGPAEVTPYSISYKYFEMLNMVFMIVATPFWSGFTEAYYKGEIDWIKSTMKKLMYIMSGFIGITIIMVASSTFVFDTWLQGKVHVPIMISLFMGLYIIIKIWETIFCLFINGVGKIKLQLYMSVGAALINIPLSIYFAKTLGLGSAGVILATCVCTVYALVLWPMQYKKIITKTDYGIWGK
ncbi:MAG: MATE family efflux transporter [Ignavibacteriales bacterium]|nr:MAG: MATE family efflux transporter [Ignavibacteriales bacterium]